MKTEQTITNFQFQQDCSTLEELIETGKLLIKQAPSVRNGNLDQVSESEQNCHKWFIETRNFIASLIGEDFRDVNNFINCFKRYSFTNLIGTYSGDIIFVREDLSKSIGVLEGLRESFKKSTVKRKEELIKSLINNPDRIRLIFDNDILNKIVEGELDTQKIINSNRFEFYSTHIQTDQLSACKDEEKRKKLVLLFAILKPDITPTETFVMDYSRIGFAKLVESQDFEKLRQENYNHTEDALIGEVAIKNKLLLITNDKTLRSRVNSNGGRAINLEEFKEVLENGN